MTPTPLLRSNMLAPLALVAITALTHLGSLFGTFVYDDLNILKSARILTSAWAAGVPLLTKRIICDLTFVWDFRIASLHDLHPVYFHASNIAIHCVAALLLYWLILAAFALPSLASSKLPARAIAFVGALFWASHPLSTAAVSVIAQRYEALASLFILATLLITTRSLLRPHPLHGAAIAIFSTLAVATKEIAIVIPLLIMVLDRCLGSFAGWRSQFHERWLIYLASTGAWFALLFLTAQTDPTVVDSSSYYASSETSSLAYLLTQFGAILHYLRISLIPAGLCFDHDLPPHDAQRALLHGLCLLPLGLTALWGVIRKHAVGFLAGGFFLVLAPTSSIIPRPDPIVEHRMYLPLAFLVVGVVAAVTSLLNRSGVSRVIRVLLVITVAAVLVRGTILRNRDFVDDVALWSSVLRVYPESPRARLGLASSLLSRGLHAEAEPHLNAIRTRTEATPQPWPPRVRTVYVQTLNNLAIIAINRNDYPAAVALLQQGLTVAPTADDLRRNLRSLNEFLDKRSAMDVTP